MADSSLEIPDGLQTGFPVQRISLRWLLGCTIFVEICNAGRFPDYEDVNCRSENDRERRGRKNYREKSKKEEDNDYFVSICYRLRVVENMGQGLSFGSSLKKKSVFGAVRCGDVDTVRTMLEVEPSLLDRTTVYGRNSAIHIAAANGQIEILAMLLERSSNPDVLNRHKQTSLMLAAMHGNISCVRKLIESGSNMVSFDSLNGRTCLHYAAYYGHTDCVQAILSAAQSSPIAVSWGYSRFVNIRDVKGGTPLHLATRQRRPECVRFLLANGALECASTGAVGDKSLPQLLGNDGSY